MKHEIMEYDVVIIGGGPAGLAAAIKLKQLAATVNQDIRLCLLEKGAQLGAHTLSGAVLEPASFKTLLPDTWQDAPLITQVQGDAFYYLTAKHAIRLPTPSPMKNHGNYIISLGALCQFLGREAEKLGCEIYPGFAATEILYNAEGEVIGVATGDMGIDKSGNPTAQYQPGMHLLAKQTLFAEGCRGQLSQLLMNRFNLRAECQPQTYALGIKEIWRISRQKHKLGQVLHTVGWPLDSKTYGGSFLYHTPDNCLSIGFVTGLDYQNPWLSPFEEMQRLKTHPFISVLLTGGERIAYGARALNEGGFQSIPKLTFPGGALIGDAAGFLNVAKIKGIHTAIESGMCAATACFELLVENNPYKSPPSPPLKRGELDTFKMNELKTYQEKMEQSWVFTELKKVRNIRPGFRYGLIPGLLNAAFETYITRGQSPWTLPYHEDYTSLKLAKEMPKIEYPKPDGKITFDRTSSVYLTNTYHDEDQPCHLVLRDDKLPIEVNYNQYASPETRYCPAAVYNIIETDHVLSLQIDAQNCIHCKSCDIKDPKQNIVWKAPQGGGGPNYQGM